MTLRNRFDGLTLPQLGALVVLVLLLCGGILALEAWLLVLVLGWFGITALGFWKAVVAVTLVDLLLTAARR